MFFSPIRVEKNTNEALSDKGFTLLEILVVLAIIATLSAIAIPTYRHYINKAKVTLAISTLETVRKKMEFYHIDFGSYPVNIDFTTGKDDQGNTVFESTLLDEITRNIFNVESYTIAINSYTLKARARDTPHTMLILTPGQVVIQVP